MSCRLTDCDSMAWSKSKTILNSTVSSYVRDELGHSGFASLSKIETASELLNVTVLATRPPGMCHQHEFQCQSDGSCVPGNWECDGHPDCADGSDEHHRCPARTCPPSLFRCDNGNCVYRAWICDGDNDCRDMSDERDCPTQPFRCPSWQWQCPGHSICVNLSKVCDNSADCPNGADESPLCSKLLFNQLL